MVRLSNALVCTVTALGASYSVYAKEFSSERKSEELSSYFPGSAVLIPLDEKPKYPSLPKDVQEELSMIADQIWNRPQACEVYNTLTKATHLHWCLPADYDTYADRSATRNNLTHRDVNFYNADDSLELAVSVYDVTPLSMLQVEVHDSLGTIIRNAAYSHDTILEDPFYQSLLASSIQTSSNNSSTPELKHTKVSVKAEKKNTEWQNYNYTLDFPLPGSDFYMVTLRIVSLETLQEQVPVDPLFQGLTRYLPTDGSYQAPPTHAYMTATVIIKPEPRPTETHDNQLWKVNPEPTPWDKKETTPVEFNGW